MFGVCRPAWNGEEVSTIAEAGVDDASARNAIHSRDAVVRLGDYGSEFTRYRNSMQECLSLLQTSLEHAFERKHCSI